MAWCRRNGGLSLVQCASLVREASVANTAWRACASEVHVLGLVPRESERSGTQTCSTRNPPSAVRGRVGTWEHGLAAQERRLLAHAVSFQRAWSVCRQLGVARARVGRARAGPRLHRERVQWRARALHTQPTSRSNGQGWHVGAQAWRRRNGAFLPVQCFSIARGASVASAARRGACARRKRKCWASSPERASAVARKRATRATYLAK